MFTHVFVMLNVFFHTEGKNWNVKISLFVAKSSSFNYFHLPRERFSLGMSKRLSHVLNMQTDVFVDCFI